MVATPPTDVRPVQPALVARRRAALLSRRRPPGSVTGRVAVRAAPTEARFGPTEGGTAPTGPSTPAPPGVSPPPEAPARRRPRAPGAASCPAGW